MCPDDHEVGVVFASNVGQALAGAASPNLGPEAPGTQRGAQLPEALVRALACVGADCVHGRKVAAQERRRLGDFDRTHEHDFGLRRDALSRPLHGGKRRIGEVDAHDDSM